ncbi:virulence RhuM family protein [Asticcacaulis sp. SL142]|uniref:RhuM family protein n=1 Tax=Asticcacaulis sp. SL142 TaxID=2995155 RepID=UPI00226D22EA|nr:RhuM family protein [Asticcacaulis sp. SL142]WAC47373.1 virulence RhuM family protein [Asticcacaulis sp. SL142]
MTDKDAEPVHLIEDADTGDRFLVYGTDKGLRLDIRYEGEALWMSQAQISQLFGRDVSTISRHINNVLDEGELEESTSLQKTQTTTGRPAILYSLDMVISVGYRVSSTQATIFRRWATSVLVQFATKGFVVDSQRLKQPENFDRVTELREIIRDIRSDEANLYRELRSICAMCQDYDGTTELAREFYQRTQAKLVYAVTSFTPAELIVKRADSSVDNMGLQTWPHENIRKIDVTVSKNYLAQTEIKELNRLTSILLDIFEDQLDLGRLTTMQEAQNILDLQLKQLGRTVLNTGGSIKASDAKRKAESQYEKYIQIRKEERQREADKQISSIIKEVKKLPKTKKK